MALVGCGNCGNAFEADKAKREEIKTERGLQSSCVCPMCGSTGCGRTLQPKDDEFEGGFGDVVDVDTDFKDDGALVPAVEKT